MHQSILLIQPYYSKGIQPSIYMGNQQQHNQLLKMQQEQIPWQMVGAVPDRDPEAVALLAV
jgi:hypothetical protein